MTTSRKVTLAAVALAAALGVVGCGSNKCNDTTPPVGALNTSSPACSAQVQAGAPVTVRFHVCPLCDQGPASCLVHAENAASGQVTLEPVSEVCDPHSCPLPDACTIPTLDCQFTAPATNVTVTVVTPNGDQFFTLGVSGSGTTPVTCTL